MYTFLQKEPGSEKNTRAQAPAPGPRAAPDPLIPGWIRICQKVWPPMITEAAQWLIAWRAITIYSVRPLSILLNSKRNQG